MSVYLCETLIATVYQNNLATQKLYMLTFMSFDVMKRVTPNQMRFYNRDRAMKPGYSVEKSKEFSPDN